MKSRRWLVPNLGHSGAGSGPPSAATVGRWEDGAELLGLGSEPRPATATAPSWGRGRGALGKGGSPHRCLRPSPRPRSLQPGPAGTFCGGGGCTGAAASAWGSCGTRNLSTLLQALLGLTGKVSLCWGGGELIQRIEPFLNFFFKEAMVWQLQDGSKLCCLPEIESHLLLCPQAPFFMLRNTANVWGGGGLPLFPTIFCLTHRIHVGGMQVPDDLVAS